MVSISAVTSKATHAHFFPQSFICSIMTLTSGWDSSSAQSVTGLSFGLTKHKGGLMTTSLICFYINFEHQSAAINLTLFINRKNSSSTETSQAPGQEKGLSSGPKMHYWVKRIDEKKKRSNCKQLSAGEISQAAYLTPHLCKEKWKARGKMQRRPRRCLRQKTNKKHPILIFIWAHIGSLLYLCPHRLFQRTLTFPQQN